jgi:hypothetical protein
LLLAERLAVVRHVHQRRIDVVGGAQVEMRLARTWSV